MSIDLKDLREKAKKWWIDDLEQRVCAPLDHPELGLDTIPWPDCEKVHVAIDIEVFDQVVNRLELLDTYRIAFEQMADDVLSSIAGFTETPAEGYKKVPWLVAGDLKRLTDQLERERKGEMK